MIIVRLEKEINQIDYRTLKYHADVKCEDAKEALKSAKEGLVRNWRFIDSYDVSSMNYTTYKILYVVNEYQAVKPMWAVNKI